MKSFLQTNSKLRNDNEVQILMARLEFLRDRLVKCIHASKYEQRRFLKLMLFQFTHYWCNQVQHSTNGAINRNVLSAARAVHDTKKLESD